MSKWAMVKWTIKARGLHGEQCLRAAMTKGQRDSDRRSIILIIVGTYLDKLVDAHCATGGVALLKHKERHSRHAQPMCRSVRSPHFGIALVAIEPLPCSRPGGEEVEQHSLIGQEVFIGEMLSVEMMRLEQVHGER